MRHNMFAVVHHNMQCTTANPRTIYTRPYPHHVRTHKRSFSPSFSRLLAVSHTHSLSQGVHAHPHAHTLTHQSFSFGLSHAHSQKKYNSSSAQDSTHTHTHTHTNTHTHTHTCHKRPIITSCQVSHVMSHERSAKSCDMSHVTKSCDMSHEASHDMNHPCQVNFTQNEDTQKQITDLAVMAWVGESWYLIHK